MRPMPIPLWPPRLSWRQCRRAGQQGFTLLEVLVAGTILSIVLAALYGVFSQTLTSQRRAEAQATRSRAARIVLLRLGDELRASPPMPASSRRFLGELQREGRYPATALTFVSALPSMHSVPGVDGGLSTVRYRLVPEEAGAVRYRLIRQVSHDIGADREPSDQAVGAYPLISHVRGFRARFFDGREWRDEWGQDSASSQLPRAVEIRLYLDGSRHEPNTRSAEHVVQFSTLVELPLASPQQGAP